MEGEMLLVAMLPREDQRLVIQTPRRRSVGELERFIVDEYARVFPHRSALSRDLRLQKRMALRDPRQPPSGAGSAADGVFVDLGKNVQVGNVFTDMEPVFVTVNPPKHALGDKKAEKAPKSKPEDAKAKRPRPATAEPDKTHEGDAAPAKKVKVKTPAAKPEAAAEKPAASGEASAAKVKKVKEAAPTDAPKPAKVKKAKEPASKVAAAATATPSAAVTGNKKAAKKAKKKAIEEAATDAKQPAVKRLKTEDEAAKEKESLISKRFGDVLKQQSTATKSATPAKIDVHEKKTGHPAKDADTVEAAAPVIVKKKLGRPSKADKEAAAAAANTVASAPEVTKKKVGRPSKAEKEAAAAATAALAADEPVVVKKKLGRPSKADKEAAAAAAAAAASTTTNAAPAPVKKKLGRPSKADKEAAAAAAAAAGETATPAPEKPAKKLGRPSRADKEAAAAASAAAGAPKKASKTDTEENGNATEENFHPFETKGRKKPMLTFTERLVAARAKVAQMHKLAQSEAETSQEHTEPETSVTKPTPAVETLKASPKVASKVSPKTSSAKSNMVASPPVQVPEPSSDSDSSETEVEDARPTTKHFSEKPQPAVVTKSPSSSDSDSSDEELDYSQSLLADLTKHG